MARRFRFRRMNRRGSFRGFKRRASHRSSGMGAGSDFMLIGGAMLYGAGREWLSDKLAPLTSKIPAGQYSDEVGLGLLGYFAMKGKIPGLNKVPMTREIGKAMVVIESARIGSGLSSGMLSTTGASGNTVFVN